ncbi:hypothetical protein SERLADRAFT_456428 [Serpula lacrymans var. lacrymans S7.9]|uniref:Uncharacterized protein n=1 Tax=Serpula lacrymans var. lacrymans (strain S7.9) TaxID=578457 RepID=F8NGM3_SERL9|nr:uncharacterized protein SERLADRAFT_456428 [Serpula lacrymans var. lacrymans S7.9]EGO29105.1 hypothetical protein SERLADRAFT_456428 [Serpula lacrymans var. lacrymans S7.9]
MPAICRRNCPSSPSKSSSRVPRTTSIGALVKSGSRTLIFLGRPSRFCSSSCSSSSSESPGGPYDFVSFSLTRFSLL